MSTHLKSEPEKTAYDILKMPQGTVAFRDIARVESLAKRKSRFITKEMIEKNIEGRMVSQDKREGIVDEQKEPEEGNKVSEFELWLVKKDFESKIKKDMMDQVLRDYDQVREIAM